MKLFLVVSLSLLLSVAVFAGEDPLDDLDVEGLLKDDAKMKVIFDCILDRGPCGEYQKLKVEILKMVPTDCSECTPKRKEKYDLGKKLASERYPKELELVIKKYALKSE